MLRRLSWVLLLFVAQDASAHLSLVRLGPESASTREANARYGHAVAAGDFDGDGYEDLATGAPNHDQAQGTSDPTGAVTINYGSLYGLDHEGAVALQFWGPDVNQRFGAALVAGDFNHDGFDDLVVGAPGRDDLTAADAGRVWIYVGAGGGLGATPDDSFGMDGLGQGAATDDEFGTALAVGRFNDDPYEDLAIGVPGRNGGAGLVAVVYGSPSGLQQNSADFFDAVDFQDSQPTGDFGRALATGHQYGDAQDELAIGAPGAIVDGVAGAGRVYMAQGSASGLLALFPIVLDATHFGLVPAGEGRFGFALATGRFMSDTGLLDLAVGEPGHNGGAGRVVVTHLNTTQDGADQFFVVDHSSLGTVGSPDDELGHALAAGDTDLDGDDELAIGAPYQDSFGDPSSGRVYLARRQATDIRDGQSSLHTKLLNAESQAFGWFGFGLAFGAFDASGQANLVVGSPGADYKRWPRMGSLGFETLSGSGQVHIHAPWRQPTSLESRGAVSFNCNGDLVFSQRPFDQLAIASTTKSMTALLVAEDIMNGVRDPNDTITISGDKEWIVDFTIGSGETLVKGETITLDNLLRLLFCKSSGEACYAIASLMTNEVDPFPANFPNPPEWESACDPSFPIVQPTFVARMNQRASQLGMHDTQFTNPHGSRSGSCLGGQRHHSTAYDMALLGRAVMQNEWLTDFIDTDSYDIFRQNSNEFACGNGLIQALRSPNLLDSAAVGVKSGGSGYANRTGVASYEHDGLALTLPAVATYMGGPSSSTRNSRLTRMLQLAGGQCAGPGPSGVLPPVIPPPPGPLAVRVQIPADDGGLPTVGLVDLEDFDHPTIELHTERWASVDASTQAQACFGTVSERELAPGETANFGIAPFDAHEGFRIRNVGAGTADLMISTSDPSGSQFVSLAPNQEYLVPAHTAVGSASFSLAVQSLSSAAPRSILVEELGYCFDVDLGTDPAGGEESLQASLTRADAGEIEYQLLSWEFRGQDTTPGNELAFSASSAGGPTAVGDELATPPSTLRVAQYPNPFNPRTTFEYTLERPGPVRVTIYDARGRVARRLALVPQQQAGTHQLVWDGADESGAAVASGVYMWRVESAEGAASGRMALVR